MKYEKTFRDRGSGFMVLIYSIKKSYKLKKLSKILGARPRIDIIDEEGMKQRYEARNELWEFCKKEK